MKNAWQKYYDELNRIGDSSTEHTYRTCFENLLNAIKPKSSITIFQEPQRKKGFGAPDFKVETEGAIIGYIETKKPDENLSKVIKSAQIKKYLSFTTNLIVTNYREYLLLKDGTEVQRCELFKGFKSGRSNITLIADQIRQMEKLFEQFFITPPQRIGNAAVLASQLATRGKILKEYIYEQITAKESDHFSRKLSGLKSAFIDTLVEDLGNEEFTDAYTQTVIYGFFLALLQSERKITIDDAGRLIPVNFEVIKEFFNLINDYHLPPHIRWIFKEIVNLLNNLDLEGIYHSMSFRQHPREQTQTDPYLYFYETFLAEFDVKKRKAKGVYYTPLPVVRFITRSIEELLIERFGKSKGFADPTVTVLDFASGTGTFLVSIFELIFSKIGKNTGSFKSLVRDHLLRNFYGFEYLVAPYAVCHLKLSQFLKDNDYEMTPKQRFQVYLTDTLDDAESKVNLFMPVLSDEGKKANQVKVKDQLLVITGNPPYNNKSRNNKPWIVNLIKDYKPTDEKKLNLDDDYIKFIRYAHWKMQQSSHGIIGIISNNSFLDGLTHRKMRNLLLKDFDEIYVLNLHGSSRQVEMTPNGKPDQNVFDIMQGVAITILVKNRKENRQGNVFYYDVFGNRKEKYKFLDEYSLQSMKTDSVWQKLDISRSNRDFKATRWGKNRFKDPLSFFGLPRDNKRLKQYGEFWGITEIFKNYNSGIQTKRDKLTVQFTKDEIREVLQDFQNLPTEKIISKYNLNGDNSGWSIKKAKDVLERTGFDDKHICEILYRPFDFRYTYFTGQQGFLGRPRYSTMQHFVGHENMGLVFMRQVVLNVPYTHFIFTDKISDLKLLRSSEGTSFVAPLYVFQECSQNHDLLREKNGTVRFANFTNEFQNYIKTLYPATPNPSDIMGYIYAICYCSNYRKEFADFLTIDFPRIPFTQSIKTFSILSSLGNQLIRHHLLKETYNQNRVVFKGVADDVVKKPVFHELSKPNAGKLYINEQQYFENIPSDVWNYQIGGYPVLLNWLKARRGRRLSYQEQQYFITVANGLRFTLKQMEKIDAIYNTEFENEMTSI